MASALQYLKECPVCPEEFTDPRVLPCDHSLCQDCIDHIKKGTKIKCPVCNTCHDVKRIRRDFRLTQFLDALNEDQKQKGTSKRDDEPHCEGCLSESASHWCKNCKQWFCNDCKQAHTRISSTKTHTLQPLCAKVQQVKAKYEKEGKAFKELLEDHAAKIREIEEKIGEFEQTQMEALEVSKKLRNQTIEDIEDFYDSIDAKILSFIQEKISKLENERKTRLGELQGTEAKWQSLEQMIMDDSRKLVVDGEAILDQAAKKAKQMKIAVNVDMEKVVVEVSRGPSWDPSTAASVRMSGGEVSHQGVTPPSAPRQTVRTGAVRTGAVSTGAVSTGTVSTRAVTRAQAALSSMISKTFAKMNEKQISFKPECLRLIDNKLWVCGYRTISVFNNNFKLMKKLEDATWNYVYDVTVMPGAGIIIACEKGLLNITSDGKTKCQIDSGNYECAVIHKDILYTCEYNTNTIRTYTYPGSWQKQNTIQLSHGKDNKLSVTHDTITACSADDNQLHVLSRSGQERHTYGKRGAGAGELRGPILCHDDTEGALLVADYFNARLQVLDKHRQWSVIDMQPAVSHPQGAVYVDDTVYVVSHSNDTLYKYSAAK